MHTTEILAICSHREILQTMLRLINAGPQWQATGALNVQEALDAFEKKRFGLVLFGSGITDSEEQLLRRAFSQADQHVIMTRHYGGGSGLLSGEILEALGSR